MADEFLKDDFRKIEISEDELAGYRSGLAEQLRTESPKLQFPPKFLILIPLAAALLMYLTFPENHFEQETPEQIEALVDGAENKVDLGRRALIRLESRDFSDRNNAVMVLCLTQIPDAAVQMAARGLQQDPRPAFRFWYLEFLLEHADEYQYNVALVEALMDVESDPLCLDLFEDLLDLNT